MDRLRARAALSPPQPHPAHVAWALLPLGYDGLDLLATVAARGGWSPWLDAVGYWLLRLLEEYL